MRLEKRKPVSSLPLVDWGDPLNHKQLGWWLANEGSGQRVHNLMGRNAFNGALQSGVTWANSEAGRTLSFDGGASAYVDLGVQAVVPSDSTPLTMSWLEYVGASPPAYAGVACFKAAGASQRWLLLRDDADVNYRFLALGLGGTLSVRRFAAAPSLASGVGLVRHWILIINDGLGGTSLSGADLLLYVDVAESIATGGGQFSSQPANLNYLGWDGADAKWKGRQDNFRLWGRRLSGTDLNRLIADPYAGAWAPRAFVPSVAAAGVQRRDRMFIVM